MTCLLSPQIRAYEAMKAEPGLVSNESWLWDSLMNEVPWVLIILRAESVELKSIRLYLTKILNFSSELSEPTEPNTANSSQVCLISQSCLRQYRSSLIKIPLAWLGPPLAADIKIPGHETQLRYEARTRRLDKTHVTHWVRKAEMASWCSHYAWPRPRVHCNHCIRHIGV